MFFKKNCPEGITFPINKKQITKLNNSKIHSVVEAKDKRVEIHPSEWPAPLMPEDGDAFWGELVEVAQKVSYGKKNQTFDSIKDDTEKYLQHANLDTSKPFVSKFIREKYKIVKVNDGAQLVRKDFPNKILSDLAVYLLENGARVRTELLPKVDFVRFTDGPVLLSHLIGWAVHQVSPTAFAAKWFYGRPRPEEVVHAWANKEIDAPQWADVMLAALVDSDKVKRDQNAFTLYKEGAPSHPSYMAMHGAGAGASVLFGVFFDLTEEELDLVRRTAMNVAIFRDFAGVHYRQDSLLGLHAGEVVVSRRIGKFLKQYGADADEVTALAESYVTGWI